MIRLARAAHAKLSKDFSGTTLTLLIIGFALFLIYLALTVKNKWVKAGILAWELFP